MIIALADLKLLIRLVNTLANAHGLTEIKRPLRHLGNLARRDLPRINKRHGLGCDFKLVILDSAASFALEVEVNMLRHVDRSILIGSGLIINAPDIVRAKRIANLHFNSAREALIAIGGNVRKHNAHVATVHKRLRAPDISIPSARTAVKVAANSARRIVKCGKLILHAVKRELARRDAVAVASNDAAPVGIAIVPSRRIVKPDNHILHGTIAVRREEPHNLATVIAHLKNNAACAIQDELSGLLAVFRYSEIDNLIRCSGHSFSP